MNNVYVNNINILLSRIDSTVTTLNIILYPGTNLIDVYCQNMEPSGYAGLIFYVKHNTTVQMLCQSNGSIKYRKVI